MPRSCCACALTCECHYLQSCERLILCKTRGSEYFPCACVCVCSCLGRAHCATLAGLSISPVRACASASRLSSVHCARLVGMCSLSIRAYVCLCLVPGLSRLCETRGYVLSTVRACVCVSVCASHHGLSILCQTLGYVPARCARESVCALCLGSVFCARIVRACLPSVHVNLCVPRAWAQSIVRDSWICAFPLCV